MERTPIHGIGTTRPNTPKLDPHLSPANREERCCPKCKECIFQAFLLSRGACMHPKKGSGLLCGLLCLSNKEKRNASDSRVLRSYVVSHAQCTQMFTVKEYFLLAPHKSTRRLSTEAFNIFVFFGTPVQFILGTPAKVYPFSSDYLRPRGKDADPRDRHHQA